jgi:hypothetical protein
MSELAPKDVSPNASAPILFKEPLDRSEAGLPDWYMPWASGVLLPSDEVIRHATENRPATLLRRRWTLFPKSEGEAHARFRIDRTWTLFAMTYGNLSVAVRRKELEPRRVQGLAFLLGSIPVCAHTLEAAKRLAEYYHINWVAQADEIGWVDTTVCRE